MLVFWDSDWEEESEALNLEVCRRSRDLRVDLRAR